MKSEAISLSECPAHFQTKIAEVLEYVYKPKIIYVQKTSTDIGIKYEVGTQCGYEFLVYSCTEHKEELRILDGDINSHYINFRVIRDLIEHADWLKADIRRFLQVDTLTEKDSDQADGG